LHKKNQKPVELFIMEFNVGNALECHGWSCGPVGLEKLDLPALEVGLAE
jgi:hypothetical protein